MPHKVHPADGAAARRIARARRFEIAFFRGQGGYAKTRAATLDEAPEAAARLEAEVANGRPSLIYALDAAGPLGPRHPCNLPGDGDARHAEDLHHEVQRPCWTRRRGAEVWPMKC
jgi:hypothetical protein